MIKINDNAYIAKDNYGYELFIKKTVETRTGNIKKGEKQVRTGEYRDEFIGGRYYSNLDNALNGYLNEYLLELAGSDTEHDLKEVINQIRLLKAELYMQFNLVTNHASPIDNIRIIK